MPKELDLMLFLHFVLVVFLYQGAIENRTASYWPLCGGGFSLSLCSSCFALVAFAYVQVTSVRQVGGPVPRGSVGEDGRQAERFETNSLSLSVAVGEIEWAKSVKTRKSRIK